MQPLPITIRRSLFGYIRIILYGGVAGGVTLGGALWLQAQPDALPIAVALLGIVGLVIVIATLVALIVYDNAKLTMAESGIEITSLTTLFWSNTSTAEWRDIEDVSVTRAGLWDVVFGTGKIVIQTAGTNVNLGITWIDNPEGVQATIDYYQGQLG